MMWQLRIVRISCWRQAEPSTKYLTTEKVILLRNCQNVTKMETVVMFTFVVQSTLVCLYPFKQWHSLRLFSSLNISFLKVHSFSFHRYWYCYFSSVFWNNLIKFLDPMNSNYLKWCVLSTFQLSTWSHKMIYFFFLNIVFLWSV